MLVLFHRYYATENGRSTYHCFCMIQSYTTCETPLGQKAQLRDRKFIQLPQPPMSVSNRYYGRLFIDLDLPEGSLLSGRTSLGMRCIFADSSFQSGAQSLSLGLRITDAVKYPATGDRDWMGQSVDREWMTQQKRLIKRRRKKGMDPMRPGGNLEEDARDQWPVDFAPNSWGCDIARRRPSQGQRDRRRPARRDSGAGFINEAPKAEAKAGC